MRHTILIACIFRPVAARSVFGQSFEVATVKPCAAPGGGGRGTVQPSGVQTPSSGRWTSSCQTVAALINLACVRFANGRSNGAPFVPLSGGPSWIRSERYVVSAKASEAASQVAMQGPMLQALLEDRFKLKIHRETREVPVYFVTVTKSGPQTPCRLTGRRLRAPGRQPAAIGLANRRPAARWGSGSTGST